MLFVSVISNEGVPGALFGPYEDYIEATDCLLQVLQSNRTTNEPIEITDEVRQIVELDGCWEYDDGGGVYLVSNEEFEEVT